MKHADRFCDFLFNKLWILWVFVVAIAFVLLVAWGTSHSYGPERIVTISRVVSGNGEGCWLVEFADVPGLHNVVYGEASLAPGGPWAIRCRSGSKAYNLMPPEPKVIPHR